MTETPRDRNRRTTRTKPEDIAPATQSRTRQAKAPIGRSQELMERQAQLRQPVQAKQPVRSNRQQTMYSDFAEADFSARAAQPVRKKKRREKDPCAKYKRHKNEKILKVPRAVMRELQKAA